MIDDTIRALERNLAESPSDLDAQERLDRAHRRAGGLSPLRRALLERLATLTSAGSHCLHLYSAPWQRFESEDGDPRNRVLVRRVIYECCRCRLHAHFDHRGEESYPRERCLTGFGRNTRWLPDWGGLILFGTDSRYEVAESGYDIVPNTGGRLLARPRPRVDPNPLTVLARCGSGRRVDIHFTPMVGTIPPQ